MNDTTPDEFLTVQEVATQLKVHYNTVYRWLLEGTLKGARAGELWRIRRTDLDQFLERHTNGKGER